ncbi:DUF2271 domain-containing protein [Flavobacterium sp. RNTU_13]|uniref:DUF2271 domain-containing protein n=1 Tax=Flavobacterium sp. RNTU_13 TaxID=3375145 RepID=UPI003987091C
MKSLFKNIIAVLAIGLASMTASAQSAKYKCMLQMNSYSGEGAYIVVSLINPKGQYEKTLYVMGDDRKWYKSLKEWHKSQIKMPENISAVTGASANGGDRSVTTLELDESKVNKGYKIRFESAVEDQKYYTTDAEIPLTTDGLSQKTEGKGYIKFVKLSKVE